MAKPICIIYFPENYSSVIPSNNNWIYEYMGFLNGEGGKNSKWEKSDYFTDYYWFCFYKYDINAPEFQVFHEKDFTDIQYQELKEMITRNLETQKP